jgi:hypothetical protein
MNETTPEKNNAAAGQTVQGRLGSGFYSADHSAAGNSLLPPDAPLQRRTGPPKAQEVAFEEMGDIHPALENLLRVQADYARRDPGTSRAMRDVAYKALIAEIRSYLLCRGDASR